MSEFDQIRPYHDHEVPEVVERIVNHPELPVAAAKILMPDLLKSSGIGAWLSHLLVRYKTKNLRSVSDCQMLMAGYFEDLIAQTTKGLTCSGLDNLEADKPYLFMSNHRDIVLDSSLLNFLLHQSGHQTSRMAVGDNLLTHELAADLMRLNKSFVIERGVSGTRAAYKVLVRTSNYIRHSIIEEGASIWIAQKEGRAKDGWDRTDPALLKMLGLAFKDSDSSGDGIAEMLANYSVVPVSVGYELDPCASAKAHELYVTDRDGSYAKADEEDVQSIITGLVGQKGRVHIHFAPPIAGDIDSPQDLAEEIDRTVMGNMRIYPTQAKAAELLNLPSHSALDPIDEVMTIFDAELNACAKEEQPFYLSQYANAIKNRQELGVST